MYLSNLGGCVIGKASCSSSSSRRVLHDVCMRSAGQHVESLGGRAGSQAIYVLIFTSFSCAGRMFCGFGSEWLLHRGHARCPPACGCRPDVLDKATRPVSI